MVISSHVAGIEDKENVCSSPKYSGYSRKSLEYQELASPFNPKTNNNTNTSTMFVDRVLQGQIFYLDPKIQQNAAWDIEKNIVFLGGKVEKFMCKDVTCVISDRRDGNKDSSCMTPSPCVNALTKSPLTTSCHRFSTMSPLGGSAFSPSPMSRGQALLMKSKVQNSASKNSKGGGTDLITTAKQLGIKVLDVKSMIKHINRQLSKCDPTSTPPTSRGKDIKKTSAKKVKPIKGIFIKFEHESEAYKPVYGKLVNFPLIDLRKEYDGSPFDPEPKKKRTIVINKTPLGTKDKENLNLYNTPKVKLKIKNKDNIKKDKKPKSGYCESCEAYFSDLNVHMISKSHLHFVNDLSNFTSLDCYMSSLPSVGELISSFSGANSIPIETIVGNEEPDNVIVDIDSKTAKVEAVASVSQMVDSQIQNGVLVPILDITESCDKRTTTDSLNVNLQNDEIVVKTVTHVELDSIYNSIEANLKNDFVEAPLDIPLFDIETEFEMNKTLDICNDIVDSIENVNSNADFGDNFVELTSVDFNSLNAVPYNDCTLDYVNNGIAPVQQNEITDVYSNMPVMSPNQVNSPALQPMCLFPSVNDNLTLSQQSVVSAGIDHHSRHPRSTVNNPVSLQINSNVDVHQMRDTDNANNNENDMEKSKVSQEKLASYSDISNVDIVVNQGNVSHHNISSFLDNWQPPSSDHLETKLSNIIGDIIEDDSNKNYQIDSRNSNIMNNVNSIEAPENNAVFGNNSSDGKNLSSFSNMINCNGGDTILNVFNSFNNDVNALNNQFLQGGLSVNSEAGNTMTVNTLKGSACNQSRLFSEISDVSEPSLLSATGLHNNHLQNVRSSFGKPEPFSNMTGAGTLGSALFPKQDTILGGLSKDVELGPPELGPPELGPPVLSVCKSVPTNSEYSDPPQLSICGSIQQQSTDATTIGSKSKTCEPPCLTVMEPCGDKEGTDTSSDGESSDTLCSDSSSGSSSEVSSEIPAIIELPHVLPKQVFKKSSTTSISLLVEACSNSFRMLTPSKRKKQKGSKLGTSELSVKQDEEGDDSELCNIFNNCSVNREVETGLDLLKQLCDGFVVEEELTTKDEQATDVTITEINYDDIDDESIAPTKDVQATDVTITDNNIEDIDDESIAQTKEVQESDITKTEINYDDIDDESIAPTKDVQATDVTMTENNIDDINNESIAPTKEVQASDVTKTKINIDDIDDESIAPTIEIQATDVTITENNIDDIDDESIAPTIEIQATDVTITEINIDDIDEDESIEKVGADYSCNQVNANVQNEYELNVQISNSNYENCKDANDARIEEDESTDDHPTRGVNCCNGDDIDEGFNQLGKSVVCRSTDDKESKSVNKVKDNKSEYDLKLNPFDKNVNSEYKIDVPMNCSDYKMDTEINNWNVKTLSSSEDVNTEINPANRYGSEESMNMVLNTGEDKINTEVYDCGFESKRVTNDIKNHYDSKVLTEEKEHSSTIKSNDYSFISENDSFISENDSNDFIKAACKNIVFKLEENNTGDEIGVTVPKVDKLLPKENNIPIVDKLLPKENNIPKVDRLLPKENNINRPHLGFKMDLEKTKATVTNTDMVNDCNLVDNVKLIANGKDVITESVSDRVEHITANPSQSQYFITEESEVISVENKDIKTPPAKQAKVKVQPKKDIKTPPATQAKVKVQAKKQYKKTKSLESIVQNVKAMKSKSIHNTVPKNNEKQPVISKEESSVGIVPPVKSYINRDIILNDKLDNIMMPYANNSSRPNSHSSVSVTANFTSTQNSAIDMSVTKKDASCNDVNVKYGIREYGNSAIVQHNKGDELPLDLSVKPGKSVTNHVKTMKILKISSPKKHLPLKKRMYALQSLKQSPRRLDSEILPLPTLACGESNISADTALLHKPSGVSHKLNFEESKNVISSRSICSDREVNETVKAGKGKIVRLTDEPTCDSAFIDVCALSDDEGIDEVKASLDEVCTKSSTEVGFHQYFAEKKAQEEKEFILNNTSAFVRANSFESSCSTKSASSGYHSEHQQKPTLEPEKSKVKKQGRAKSLNKTVAEKKVTKSKSEKLMAGDTSAKTDVIGSDDNRLVSNNLCSIICANIPSADEVPPNNTNVKKVIHERILDNKENEDNMSEQIKTKDNLKARKKTKRSENGKTHKKQDLHVNIAQKECLHMSSRKLNILDSHEDSVIDKPLPVNELNKKSVHHENKPEKVKTVCKPKRRSQIDPPTKCSANNIDVIHYFPDKPIDIKERIPLDEKGVKRKKKRSQIDPPLTKMEESNVMEDKKELDQENTKMFHPPDWYSDISSIKAIYKGKGQTIADSKKKSRKRSQIDPPSIVDGDVATSVAGYISESSYSYFTDDNSLESFPGKRRSQIDPPCYKRSIDLLSESSEFSSKPNKVYPRDNSIYKSKKRLKIEQSSDISEQCYSFEDHSDKDKVNSKKRSQIDPPEYDNVSKKIKLDSEYSEHNNTNTSNSNSWKAEPLGGLKLKLKVASLKITSTSSENSDNQNIGDKTSKQALKSGTFRRKMLEDDEKANRTAADANNFDGKEIKQKKKVSKGSKKTSLISSTVSNEILGFSFSVNNNAIDNNNCVISSNKSSSGKLSTELKQTEPVNEVLTKVKKSRKKVKSQFIL